jgi:hypothetical protein
VCDAFLLLASAAASLLPHTSHLTPPYTLLHPLPPSSPTHTPSAGEVLEVAVACGAEAQEAAVDLILGKGCVRHLGPDDEPLIR